jgi:hypothetical protein
LKVTFDLSDNARLTEWQYQRHSQSIEIFVFSFCSQAENLAFAENSASPPGLVAQTCGWGVWKRIATVD